MKELNRTDRLTIATTMLAIILIIGLVTMRKPAVEFAIPATEVAKLATDPSYVIPVTILAEMMKNNDPALALIDVRNPVKFRQEHIPSALNIPSADLLSEQNLNLIKNLAEEDKKIIIYGGNHLEANGSWLILKQLGINNLYILDAGLEGYNLYRQNLSVNLPFEDVKSERPAYNYNEILNSFGTSSSAQETGKTEPVRITKKAKKSAAEGGC